jgi:STE24 endopeptidase
MNETKASRYQRLRRSSQAIAIASGGAMLAVLVLTPASPRLASWSQAAARGFAPLLQPAAALALFVLCAVGLWQLVALPAVLYLGLVVDRRFTRGEGSLARVLGAHGRATLIGLAGAVLVAAAIAVSAELAGAWWWLAASALLTAGHAAALSLAPALLQATGAARPMARPALRARLAELAARARVPVASIDEWQTDEPTVTAFVAGVGRSRGVFVSSQLARDWSDDEITVVVAHELAHHAHRDLWRALVLDSSVFVAALWTAHAVLGWAAPRLGLGVGGASDLAALPLLALVGGGVWLAATPVRHAQSRRQERRADRFALALTGSADAFAAAIRRLGERHLSEERPSRLIQWMYYRHPSVSERLALAAQARLLLRLDD